MGDWPLDDRRREAGAGLADPSPVTYGADQDHGRGNLSGPHHTCGGHMNHYGLDECPEFHKSIKWCWSDHSKPGVYNSCEWCNPSGHTSPGALLKDLEQKRKRSKVVGR
jgi:hypothetical protein